MRNYERSRLTRIPPRVIASLRNMISGDLTVMETVTQTREIMEQVNEGLYTEGR